MCDTYHYTATHCSFISMRWPKVGDECVRHNAPYCNTLHYTALHCNSSVYDGKRLQVIGMGNFKCIKESRHAQEWGMSQMNESCRTHAKNCRCRCPSPCNTMQHNATHCNFSSMGWQRVGSESVRHTATHCNTLNTLQHTAAYCNFGSMGWQRVVHMQRIALQSFMWLDSFLWVTWLLYVCDMTHLCVWHDKCPASCPPW